MKEATTFLNLSSIDAKVEFEIDDFYDHKNDENDFGDFEFIVRQEYFTTQYTKETMTDFDYNNFARRVHPNLLLGCKPNQNIFLTIFVNYPTCYSVIHYLEKLKLTELQNQKQAYGGTLKTDCEKHCVTYLHVL